MIGRSHFLGHASCTLVACLTAAIAPACGNSLDLGERPSEQTAEDGGEEASSSSAVPEGGSDREAGGGDAGSAPTCGRGTSRPHCRVFLTDARAEANFGGLAGGDARCAAAAEGARLDGRFKAYLSDGVVAAWSRFQSDGPWHLVGSNQKVLDRRSDLKVDGPLPLDRNERGQVLEITGHWTGVREQGFGGKSCDGFTSLSKDLEGSFGSSAPSRWLYQASVTCDGPVGFHVLCLED